VIYYRSLCLFSLLLSTRHFSSRNMFSLFCIVFQTHERLDLGANPGNVPPGTRNHALISSANRENSASGVPGTSDLVPPAKWWSLFRDALHCALLSRGSVRIRTANRLRSPNGFHETLDGFHLSTGVLFPALMTE